MIKEIEYIDFGNGNIIRNPQFNYDKYVNEELQFIYPCSALTIEFNKLFTSNKVVICFKTQFGSNINEIQVFGK